MSDVVVKAVSLSILYSINIIIPHEIYYVCYVLQLISRRLKQAGGFTGAEGAKDDDWIVVSIPSHTPYKAIFWSCICYLTLYIPFTQSPGGLLEPGRAPASGRHEACYRPGGALDGRGASDV